MKKIFVIKVIIIAILLIIACSTIVSALSFTATMTPSSTTVAESSEFTVTIKVSNLDVGQNGINALSGYLKYDTTVFEVISESSIEGLNGWSQTFNPDNGKITLTKTSFVKSEESVFLITFKTKSGISGKSGPISFTNILASNSAQEISATDISTTITIGTATEETPNPITNNTITNKVNNTINNAIILIPRNNTVQNNIKTNNVVQNNATYNTTNNTVANKVLEEDIPYTGVEDTVLYIMLIVLVLSIIFYVKYQKINNDLK